MRPTDRRVMPNAHRCRSIFTYTALLLLTILSGLGTRRYPALFPDFIARYGGDTLWAAMVFWLLALVWRTAQTTRLAATALAIAYAVECSQLYHAPWIDAIRGTRLGALVLGQGFLWSDLACYTVGIFGATLIDAVLERQTANGRYDRRDENMNH